MCTEVSFLAQVVGKCWWGEFLIWLVFGLIVFIQIQRTKKYKFCVGLGTHVNEDVAESVGVGWVCWCRVLGVSVRGMATAPN